MRTYYLPSIASMSIVLMPFPWILSTSLSGFSCRLRTLLGHTKRQVYITRCAFISISEHEIKLEKRQQIKKRTGNLSLGENFNLGCIVCVVFFTSLLRLFASSHLFVDSARLSRRGSSRPACLAVKYPNIGPISKGIELFMCVFYSTISYHSSKASILPTDQ